MRILSSLAALALLAAPLPALACSPAAGYRVPTNLELAQSADMILLATVLDGSPMDAIGDPDDMRVRIGPVSALKGNLADAPTTLPLALATGDYAILSNPYDLQNAHPLAYAGACIRYMAPRGSRILFFLNRRDGEWVPAGGPFSRWAEDVLTDDAPWLEATELYAEVAAMPEAKRRTALTETRDILRAKIEDPVGQLLADDIDRQLAGPNKPLREELPPPEE